MTNHLNVIAPPTIVREQVVMMRHKNKKGKPVGNGCGFSFCLQHGDESGIGGSCRQLPG